MEWLAVGGFVTIAGVLIKFRGWTVLLAGYDVTPPVPDDVVQDVAGNTILRIGIAVFVVGILESVMNTPSYFATVIGAVIVLDELRMLHRVNSYAPTES